MRPLTVGTAGHVDHGKTTLVRALTGVETDRLPAERERGLTIELGFAPLDLPGGRRLSLVDVPGHERFVRTMVAGATGIDLWLMTVAADDGVMPQTREHAAVLRALAVRSGVVAITKADLADPAVAVEGARDLLGEGVEVVVVSARTGVGLGALRVALGRVASGVRSRADAAAPARLPVDRVFTVRGAGTVVTGTLWAGTVGRGDALAVVGADGVRSVRVRGVQVHDEAAARAAAGQRVAVNLAGVDRDAVRRGDWLAAPDAGVAPSFVIDVTLDAPAEGRVTVHHGTTESPARVVARDGGHRLRLERPLATAAGDRFVVRAIAPADTLTGGVVLDPAPRRRRAAAPNVRTATPEVGGSDVRALTDAQRALAERLRAAGHEPPSDDPADRDDLAALREHGLALRLGRAMHAHPDAAVAVERRVRALVARDGHVTLGALRDDLATTRRFAQAWLEHLDGAKVTLRRSDDTRVLRRRAQP